MSEPTIHIKQWKQIKLAISKKNVTNETIKSLLQATDGYLKDVYNSNVERKKTILETINLILNDGALDDGTADIPTRTIFRSLKYFLEFDFPIFEKLFARVFKFAGSLALAGGRDEVMYFANRLKSAINYDLVVVGKLPNDSTQIVVESKDGRTIILKDKNFIKKTFLFH